MSQQLINKYVKLLYKETDIKYANDDDVDPDDLFFLCEELYRHELLQTFFLGPEDFDNLTNKVEELYTIIKDRPEIITLIQEHQFLNDDFATFMTLFSYDLFYKTYPILVSLNC
jgi:hypothetical protein